MTANFWLIGLSNTIHIIATVIWIGWSFLLPVVIAPHVISIYQQPSGWRYELVRRLSPVAYGALAALGATGMLQMGAHPHYEGWFVIGNLWSTLLFAKHLLILVSVALLLYLVLSIMPQLRLAVRRAALGKENHLATLAARFRLVAWLNGVAALVVLLMTGLMTAVQ